MVRNAQSNRIAFGMLQAAGNFAGCLQDKRITAGRACFEQPILAIVYSGIGGDFRQAPAHQREMMLVIELPDGADTLYRGFVTDMATQGIAGICRVNDDPAVAYNGCGLPDQA